MGLIVREWSEPDVWDQGKTGFRFVAGGGMECTVVDLSPSLPFALPVVPPVFVIPR